MNNVIIKIKHHNEFIIYDWFNKFMNIIKVHSYFIIVMETNM
jgi:hypothetical protein